MCLYLYQMNTPSPTVFENHRKSLIQHCERSEQRLHFEWTKVNEKYQIEVHFGILNNVLPQKPEQNHTFIVPDNSFHDVTGFFSARSPHTQF